MSQVTMNGSKPIKLISMKQHGPLLRLTVSIGETVINQGASILSDNYNIHNFVIVHFKASREAYTGYNNYNSNPKMTYEMAMKKPTSVKDMTVLLKVVCAEANFMKDNIVCTEHWCAWTHICDTTNESLVIELELKLSKTHSVIDMKLYNDETFTDFTLSGEDGSVVVHKAHLAAHSDPFTRMLQGTWKDTKESCMQLKGVTRKTLNHFKEYLYLSTLPKHNEDLRALLLLATQYLIESLRAECMMKLLQTITAENLDSLVDFCTENVIDELLRIIHETTPESVLAQGYAMRIKKRISSVTEDAGKNEGPAKKKSRKK